MTQDDFEEICREALIERHLLADFSPGSIDKVTRVIMKVVKNRLEITKEHLSSQNDVSFEDGWYAACAEIQEALGLSDG